MPILLRVLLAALPQDMTDYMWFKTTIALPSASAGPIAAPEVSVTTRDGSIAYAFVDGVSVPLNAQWSAPDSEGGTAKLAILSLFVRRCNIGSAAKPPTIHLYIHVFVLVYDAKWREWATPS